MAETWQFKERIEPGEAMPNAGASDDAEVFERADLGISICIVNRNHRIA